MCSASATPCNRKTHAGKWLGAQIKAASRQAGVSTASGGKFDATLPGEKPGERAPPGKRKRPLVDKVAGPSGAENTKVCTIPLQGFYRELLKLVWRHLHTMV